MTQSCCLYLCLHASNKEKVEIEFKNVLEVHCSWDQFLDGKDCHLVNPIDGSYINRTKILSLALILIGTIFRVEITDIIGLFYELLIQLSRMLFCGVCLIVLANR